MTAKEILQDKADIYKSMSEAELTVFIHLKMDENVFGHLIKYFNIKVRAYNVQQMARKLYLRWHYKDGRPKPKRVHEVNKLRARIEYDNGVIQDITKQKHELESKLKLAHNKLIDYVAKVSIYQSEKHLKNIEIIKLQNQVNRAKLTTKIWITGFALLIIGIKLYELL